MKLSYDLHLHSCLSPCGDRDMTPNNIVNMASLLGLDVYPYLPKIRNKPEIFGEQLVLDENDSVIGEEPYLLINALSLPLDELIHVVKRHDGLAIPAHADKNAYSITASLGMIPPEYEFPCIEQKNPDAVLDFSGGRIFNSDAHYLEHINEPLHFLESKDKSISSILHTLLQMPPL